MESLIADGLIAGVLDITTTELADELVGGVLSAGPTRLTAAAKAGHPASRLRRRARHGQLSPRETVPEQFHRPQVPPPQRQRHADAHHARGKRQARRRNRPQGRRLHAARRPSCSRCTGVSAIDRTGQPFDDPAARQALFTAMRQSLTGIELIELDCHINDRPFAETAAKKLIALMTQQKTRPHSG